MYICISEFTHGFVSQIIRWGEIQNFPAKPGILILDKTHSDVFVT